MRTTSIKALIATLTLEELEELERLATDEIFERKYHRATDEEIRTYWAPPTDENPHPKIEAIKMIRKRTGVGLAEAKRILDNTTGEAERLATQRQLPAGEER